MAIRVTTEPMAMVRITHSTLLGKTSVSAGVGTLKAMPMAVAATEIMAPARMQ